MVIERFGDALIIEGAKYDDNRGYFKEIWNELEQDKLGFKRSWVQDNLSYSEKQYTLRGLHLQKAPSQQAKFVSCVAGHILDVIVDARKNSSLFGKHFLVELSEENSKQLFVPEGYLHGFITLAPGCLVAYKCSKFYNPCDEITVAYDDKSLNITWPISADKMTISEKDRNGVIFRDVF